MYYGYLYHDCVKYKRELQCLVIWLSPVNTIRHCIIKYVQSYNVIMPTPRPACERRNMTFDGDNYYALIVATKKLRTLMTSDYI